MSSPPSCYSSSCSSLSDDAAKSCGGSGSCSGGTVKFLCSYGGKILPRYPDGKLRYVGGDTRVLAVDRAVPFSELLAKMGELCGWGKQVSLRCQLPIEDLDDALISVTSDEDLTNLIEEYDLANRDRASPLKIRAFLVFVPKSSSPPISAGSSPRSSVKGKSTFTQSGYGSSTPSTSHHRILPSASGVPPCHCQHPHLTRHQTHSHYVGAAMSATPLMHKHLPNQVHLVHNGNHWQ